VTGRAVLAVRADAGPRIGSGHLVRSSALGSAWAAAGGDVVFLTSAVAADYCADLAPGHRVIPLEGETRPLDVDLEATLGALRDFGAAWVALDGQQFDDGYHRRLRDAGHRVLVIDDVAHLPRYDADVLVNQNIDAGSLAYVTGEDCRRLLGPEYALLRPQFTERARSPREPGTGPVRLLVTLGAADAEQLTLRVVEAVEPAGAPGLETTIVIGPANADADEVASKLAAKPALRIVRAPSDMAALMADADLAVSAAGSTCWELAFMGVPCLLLVTGPDQAANASGLDREGFAVNLGPASMLRAEALASALTRLAGDAERRHVMAERGRRLVDGRGCDRVVGVLKEDPA